MTRRGRVDLGRIVCRAWLAVLLITWALPALGAADDTVCAVVKIEIEQELTLERQAFEARMRITNSLDTLALDNVHIQVQFTDDSGQPVIASSDPNATDAVFFIRVDHLDGIAALDGGTIAAGATADIRWLIIPAPGASDGLPQGKLYFVGATLDYTVGGKAEHVDVAPDGIFVKPMPQLTLDYFLPRDVHANDPFTDVIEPAEPFTLGVRVRNNGQGVARKVSIDSAQPRIVENAQGLAIGFEILDSQVDDRPVAPTLLLDFGDIPPQAAAVGRWRMVTSLSGKFVDFQAAFTHADELGGALTSLLEAANTHWRICDVLVDLPGRDSVRDFLAEDGDALRVHESSGDDFPVTDHTAQSVLTFVGQQGDEHHYTLDTAEEPGFLYVQLPGPGQGACDIREVIRSDGKRLRTAKAWSRPTTTAPTRTTGRKQTPRNRLPASTASPALPR